jgi:hypothetical protein
MREEREQAAIEALITTAIREVKLRKDSDLEKELRTLAKKDLTTATAIVGGLRPIVDLNEYGRAGDEPGSPDVSAEVARLARKFGGDPTKFAGRKPLGQRWRDQIKAKEAAQLARFSPTTAATGG